MITRCVPIRDLQNGVRIPSIQRALDGDRVDAIVRYQRDRIARGLEPLFLGALVVVAPRLDADRALEGWVVDGQHRLAAARELVDVAPDHLMAVNVVDGRQVSLSEAFQLVNRAVPVPD
jgi:hypothetical protein